MYLIILLSIARTPQLYIHRSGRTARASSNGVTLSIVSPEDLSHQESIYRTIFGQKGSKEGFEVWKDNGSINMTILQDRVKVAKKVI